MTVEEFSNEFDVLVNSYKRFKAYDSQEILDSIEFNEYEKSVFLTKAQEETVLSLYTGKNPYGDSFENTEELRRYLSNLVVDKTLEPITTSDGSPLGVASNSKFFTLPDNLWFITYESVTTSGSNCDNRKYMRVFPVKEDEYQAIRSNPFRGANKRRALRLDLSEGNIEIICKFEVIKYYIRYIKKLSPIILEDMPNGLTVNDIGTETECQLHESLHRRILERAVAMGLQSKGYTASKE